MLNDTRARLYNDAQRCPDVLSTESHRITTRFYLATDCKPNIDRPSRFTGTPQRLELDVRPDPATCFIIPNASEAEIIAEIESIGEQFARLDSGGSY